MTDVIFNTDKMQTELVVIVRDSETNATSAAYSTLESHRTARVATMMSPVFFYILNNNPRAIQVLKMKDGELM